MPISPRQWREAERWLARARQDIRAAELMLAAVPSEVDAAAFHCQQAAEKLAKALIVAAAMRPPKLHNIKMLAHMLRPHFPAIADGLASLGESTRWYIASRYPDAEIESLPTEKAVRAALDQLRKLDREIAKLSPNAPG